jgi:hypothetical protein
VAPIIPPEPSEPEPPLPAEAPPLPPDDEPPLPAEAPPLPFATLTRGSVAEHARTMQETTMQQYLRARQGGFIVMVNSWGFQNLHLPNPAGRRNRYGHLRTTISVPDALLDQAKQEAEKEGKTLS